MTTRVLATGAFIAIGAALLAQGPPPPPQPPPPLPSLPPVVREAPVVLGLGTASLSGTVLTEEATPLPVRRATVRLGGLDSSGGRIATTDDAGRFAFAGVPAGRYLL